MKQRSLCVLAILCIGVLTAVVSARTPVQAVDQSRFARIDEVIQGDIAAQKLPGAVVVVGQGDSVVYRQTYGHRALQPAPEPMTADTIFDLASLTKVVATTSAVMMLVEDGRIRLTDPVAIHIPEFAKYGKIASPFGIS